MGVFSRLISIPLIVTMIVAYITTEKEAIAALFHQDYEDFFAATPWLYLFACMLILLWPKAGSRSMAYGAISPRAGALTHHHYDAEDLVQQAWLKLSHRYGRARNRTA